MKRLMVLMAAAVLASSGSLHAQERAQEGGGITVVGDGGPVTIRVGEAQANTGAPLGAWGGRGAAKAYIDNIDKIATLTDEQKQQMTDIFDARDKAINEFSANNGEKLKAASKALTDAYKSQDQEAIAQAQGDYQAIYAPMQEIMKKSSDQLNKVLTREQNEKIVDDRAMNLIKMMTAGITLTPGQIKELKAAYRNTEPDGETLTQAIDRVLTPEQKATLVKGRAMQFVKGSFYQAKLTADQLQQVETICDKLAKDPNLDPSELYQQLADKTKALLTDDQKEAMKNSPQNSPQLIRVGEGGFPAGGQAKPTAPVGGDAQQNPRPR